MYRKRVLVAAALLFATFGGAARAQRPDQQPTHITLQYHELVPADRDTTPTFVKLVDRIRNDCVLIGKAFGRTCAINQVNISVNGNYGGDMTGTRMVNATAALVLPPARPEAPAAPPPGK